MKRRTLIALMRFGAITTQAVIRVKEIGPGSDTTDLMEAQQELQEALESEHVSDEDHKVDWEKHFNQSETP